MNDEITQRLVRYLDALESSAVKGGEFIEEQAPEVCREIVAWHIANGLVGITSCFAVVGIIWFARYAIAKALTATSPTPEDGLIASGLTIAVASIMTVAAIGIAVDYSIPVVKAIYAHRLVVIEEIRKSLP